MSFGKPYPNHFRKINPKVSTFSPQFVFGEVFKSGCHLRL